MEISDSLKELLGLVPPEGHPGGRNPPEPPISSKQQKPIDDFWERNRQPRTPEIQKQISGIKQEEYGKDLPKAIKQLEDALATKNMDGTIRRILRTEYRDLADKEYGVEGWKPWKPQSKLDVSDGLKELLGMGEKAGDVVNEALMGLGASPEVSAGAATATSMIADPTNLIPSAKIGKGLLAVGALAGKHVDDISKAIGARLKWSEGQAPELTKDKRNELLELTHPDKPIVESGVILDESGKRIGHVELIPHERGGLELRDISARGRGEELVRGLMERGYDIKPSKYYTEGGSKLKDKIWSNWREWTTGKAEELKQIPAKDKGRWDK